MTTVWCLRLMPWHWLRSFSTTKPGCSLMPAMTLTQEFLRTNTWVFPKAFHGPLTLGFLHNYSWCHSRYWLQEFLQKNTWAFPDASGWRLSPHQHLGVPWCLSCHWLKSSSNTTPRCSLVPFVPKTLELLQHNTWVFTGAFCVKDSRVTPL